MSENSKLNEDGAARCWPVARQCLLGLSLVIACQAALAQAMYRIKPIGALSTCAHHYSPRVAGLNAADEVALTACNGRGESHAFLWKNNGSPMIDLGPEDMGSESEAVGINRSGQVGGSAIDSSGSYIFLASSDGSLMTKIYNTIATGSSIKANALNDLGQLTGEAGIPYDFNTGLASKVFIWKNDGSPLLDLGGLQFGEYNRGLAINASGQIAGINSNSETPYSVGFVWLNNGTSLTEVPPGGSFLINASAQVAGTGWFQLPGGPGYRAYLRTPGGSPLKRLGTLGGASSFALALNDSGQLAGWSHTSHFQKQHAFVWMNNGTGMKDLGTLGGNLSQANDLNASAQVTGWASLAGNSIKHAFFWRNDGSSIQDLNKLIDSTDPLRAYVTLTTGWLINDFGDIVAEGVDSRTGQSSEYLLQGTVLTLSPRSLAFGSHQINITTAAKSVTVTNTSPKAVAITSINLAGTGASQFSSTNNCNNSLAGKATCTINVKFKPTTKGVKSAILRVNGGGGGLRTVALTGTGT